MPLNTHIVQISFILFFLALFCHALLFNLVIHIDLKLLICIDRTVKPKTSHLKQVLYLLLINLVFLIISIGYIIKKETYHRCLFSTCFLFM